MAATLTPPRLLPSGDSAITVEFSAQHRRCRQPAGAGARPRDGGDANRGRHRDRADLSLAAGALRSRANFIRSAWRTSSGAGEIAGTGTTKTRRWRIPVVYGGEHGVDLEDVAKTLKTTPDDIVARHVAGDYRVAMIGFTPGWSYLSGLADFAADAAAAKSAPADAGRHGLDRRRADRRAMPGRPQRLASARTDRGPDLSAASRSDFPAGARRRHYVLRRSTPKPLPSRTAPRQRARSWPS